MRIGIHSGPLLAGVIGRKKFAYDVWGVLLTLLLGWSLLAFLEQLIFLSQLLT